MPRLNAEMRADIVHAVTTHAFKARIDDHRINHSAVANAVYNDCYDAGMRRRMDGLPKSWLPTGEHLKISVAMQTVLLDFAGNESRYGAYCLLHDSHIKAVHRRFPFADQGSTIKVYDPEHAVTEMVNEFTAARARLIEEIKTAHAKTAATIETFFTTEKLVEAWPEITPFIPEKARPKPQLPAVPTADLNAMLGLPVTTDA